MSVVATNWALAVTEKVLTEAAARRAAKAAERLAAKKAEDDAKAARRAARVAARPRKVSFAEMVAGQRESSPDERRLFERRFRLSTGAADLIATRLRCFGSADEPDRLAFLLDVVDGKGESLGLWSVTGAGKIGRNGLICPALTDAKLDDTSSPLLCPVGLFETLALAASGYAVVGRTNDTIKRQKHLADWRRANGFAKRSRYARGGSRSARPIATFSSGAAVLLMGKRRELSTS
jgi:hypothetical protein